MKITCPECTTIFHVPAAAMGQGPRRVKCASCGHIWMQGPVTETPAYTDIGVDPIPPSVRPDDIGQDSGLPASPGFDWRALLADINRRQLARMLGGFALTAALTLGLINGLAMAHMLPAALEPLAFTHSGAADMEGLQFQDIEAKAHEGGVTVTGRVFNNSTSAHPIPMIELTPDHGEAHQVRPEQDSLPAHEGVAFAAELPPLDPGTDLRLRFLP